MVHLSIPMVAQVMDCGNHLRYVACAWVMGLTHTYRVYLKGHECSFVLKYLRLLFTYSPCSEIHSDGCLAVANPATMNGWRGDFPIAGWPFQSFIISSLQQKPNFAFTRAVFGLG